MPPPGGDDKSDVMTGLAYGDGKVYASLGKRHLIAVYDAAVGELVTTWQVLTPGARLFLATGFCGGFTTMSSMVYESMQMFRSGEYLHGSLYAGVTVAGSALAFLAGAVGVRMLIMSAGKTWN